MADPLLLDREAQIRHALLEAYMRAWPGIRDDLAMLTARIDAAGDGADLAWLAREESLIRLELRVLQEIARIAATMRPLLTEGQRAALDRAEALAREQIATGMGPPPPGAVVTVDPLPADAVQALVTASLQDSPLAAFLDNLAPAARDDVRSAVERGVITSQPVDAVARNVRAAIGGNRLRAETVARDALMTAYREGSRAIYRRNADVVKGWRWLAALGPRCCGYCWAMHGTEHDLDEPLISHARCRCVPQPIVRDWASLGYDVPERPQETPTGVDLFDALDAEDQRAILGPAKYAAYQRGELELRDLVGRATVSVTTESGARHRFRVGFERSLKAVLGEKRAAEIIKEAA